MFRRALAPRIVFSLAPLAALSPLLPIKHPRHPLNSPSPPPKKTTPTNQPSDPPTQNDTPAAALRRSYEDNGDAVNNLMVLTQPTGAKTIEDLGAPEKVLESLAFLLGKQNFEGKTISEGGFAPDRVSAASLLGVKTVQDKKGKSYYR